MLYSVKTLGPVSTMRSVAISANMAKAGETDAEKLASLYNDLQRFGDAQNYGNALRVAESS